MYVLLSVTHKFTETAKQNEPFSLKKKVTAFKFSPSNYHYIFKQGHPYQTLNTVLGIKID